MYNYLCFQSTFYVTLYNIIFSLLHASINYLYLSLLSLGVLNPEGNNKMLFVINKALLLLFLFFSVYSHACISALSACHSHIVSVQGWKAVDIDYYHDIKVDNGNINAAKKYSHCTRASHNANTLRCEGHARLMRPADIIEQWLKEQNMHGYFLFTVKEFNMKAAHGHIISVSNNKHHMFYRHHYNVNANANIVTGLFVRYTNQIKKYRFITVKKNKISEIKATPNHPFYVVNKRAFISISKISPTKDIMVNNKGESIRLLCLHGRIKHCGMNYRHEPLVPVYNLEIFNAHNYFVGKNRILVHNNYLEEQIERLKKIPNGAEGKHEQATKELQGVEYGINADDESDGWVNGIEYHAIYRHPIGRYTIARAHVLFSEHDWIIRNIYREENVSFYANDLFRHMYLKALECTHFDIIQPKSICISSIINTATIETMAATSSELSNLKQMPIFYTTPLGKMLERILRDFNFQVVECSNLAKISSDYLKFGGVKPKFSFTIKPV